MDWGVITFTAAQALAWIGLGSAIVALSVGLAFLVAWITDHTEGRR